MRNPTPWSSRPATEHGWQPQRHEHPAQEKFSRRLHGRFNLPVHCIDEGLSTFTPKQRSLRESGPGPGGGGQKGAPPATRDTRFHSPRPPALAAGNLAWRKQAPRRRMSARPGRRPLLQRMGRRNCTDYLAQPPDSGTRAFVGRISHWWCLVAGAAAQACAAGRNHWARDIAFYPRTTVPRTACSLGAAVRTAVFTSTTRHLHSGRTGRVMTGRHHPRRTSMNSSIIGRPASVTLRDPAGYAKRVVADTRRPKPPLFLWLFFSAAAWYCLRAKRVKLTAPKTAAAKLWKTLLPKTLRGHELPHQPACNSNFRGCKLRHF